MRTTELTKTKLNHYFLTSFPIMCGCQTKLPLYPYHTSFQPNQIGKTEIYANKLKMTEEGFYGFDGDGYFTTIPHETAHADPI